MPSSDQTPPEGRPRTVSRNPHDALLRALLDDPAAAARLLRDMLPTEIARRLSGEPPTLQDGSFVDRRLRGTTSDRLYRVTLRDGRPAFLYVLVEHKSRPDPRTPLQVLGYMVRIWERHAGRDPGKLASLPPILPLVLYHGRVPWTVPTAVMECLDSESTLINEVRDFRYHVRDLGRLVPTSPPVGDPTWAVLRALATVGRDGRASVEVLAGIVAALPDGSLLERQVVHYIVQVARTLTVADWRAVAAQARPDGEDAVVSLAAQEWMRQGKALGVAEGKALGVAEGEVRALMRAIRRALTARFGPVPDAIESRLRSLPLEALDALLERALTAPDLDSVFEDNARH